jgi:hypothetical protein
MTSVNCDGELILHRKGRVHFAWPVTGLVAGDTVAAELESSGTMIPLSLTPDLSEAVGYFAGPGFVTPAPAAVVPITSHVTIWVTTSSDKLPFDGGFIQLTGAA